MQYIYITWHITLWNITIKGFHRGKSHFLPDSYSDCTFVCGCACHWIVNNSSQECCIDCESHGCVLNNVAIVHLFWGVSEIQVEMIGMLTHDHNFIIVIFNEMQQWRYVDKTYKALDRNKVSICTVLNMNTLAWAFQFVDIKYRLCVVIAQYIHFLGLNSVQ